MSWKKVRIFTFCCMAFLCLQGAAMPAFAADEVYAIQVGTVYYEASAAGVQTSNVTVEKTTITHLFADASVVQVGREDERFLGCTNLQVVNFSSASSLKIIYSETFRNCTSLHTVILPSSVSEIQAGAFRGCTALTSIDLSATAITSITNHTFNGCTALKTVALPSALTSIDYYAFYNCKALVLGNALQSTALKTIGNHAFYDCASIVSVTLPSTVTAIESNAFSQCSSFSTLALGSTPPSVSSDAFTNCAQSFVLEISESAIATYKAVNDGDTTDDYWYGWLIDQIDVTSQLSLSISGWTYQSGGAPSPSLTSSGVALTSDVTYLYATSQNGTYQSADALPRSSAGEIEAGTYWCMAVYDAARECGTVSKAFTVAQKKITATLWVLGITKVYDGTTTITGLQPTIVLEGGLEGDAVTAAAADGFAYASADVGTDKKITASGLSLSGTDAANYTLSATTASETGAEITTKSVTVPPPKAGDITKGDTLEDSTLTEDDDTDVPGHWEWVDGDTVPDETGTYPAIFIPDDDNYAPYGPVDVQVVVNDADTPSVAASVLFGGDDTGEDDTSGDDDGTDADDTLPIGWLKSLWNNLFSRNASQDAGAADAGAADAGAADADGGADGAAHWALANLLLCLATMVGSVLLWVRYYRLYHASSKNSAQHASDAKAAQAAAFARWEHASSWRYNTELLVCLGSLVPVLAAVLCFVLTQTITAAMCFVDWWTLLMLLLAALQAALVVYITTQHKTKCKVNRVQKNTAHAQKYVDGD